MNRKTRIKVIMVVSILVISWFSDWSFAEDVSSEPLKSFSEVLNFAVSILSWIWVWFAKWAWEFLTNRWVYWEALNLDSLLWQYWNVVKNFANFWLWFYFVYVIFKALVGKEQVIKKIKDMLLWILLAWVWIQASWFLIAVIVDVSTITLAAAWSFPSQVVSSSKTSEEAFRSSLSEYLEGDRVKKNSWKLVELFPVNARSNSLMVTYPVELSWNMNDKELIDSILPDSKSVSWPLYYIWFSILETNFLPSVDDSSEKWWKATIFNTILQWWTSIVYSLEMLVLFVFSVMRVLYIWMFIILSPVIILIWCISKWSWWTDKVSDSWFLKDFTKHLSFSSFFLNVFRPTIIVLLIWLTVIFVSLMKKIILDNADKDVDIWWVKIVSHNDWNSSLWDTTYTTTLDSNLLHFSLVRASQTLMWLLLSIITVILVYVIIKVWFSMWWWSDFVSNTIKKAQDLVGKAVWSIPIIPVSSYDSQWVPVKRHISAWSIFDVNTGESKLFDSWRIKKEWEIKNRIADQAAAVEELFWWSDKYSLSAQQEQKLIWVWNDNQIRWKWLEILQEQQKIIKSFDDKSWFTLKWDTSNSKTWVNQFTKRLNDVDKSKIAWNYKTEWVEMINWWRDEKNKDNRSLENLFRDSRYVKAYSNLFGLWDKVVNWWDLMNQDISGGN